MSTTPDNTYACPCCGGRIADLPKREHLLEASLSPMERKIVETILSSQLGTVTVMDLIEGIYGSDPANDPISAQISLHVTIGRLRKKLAPSGWTVRNILRGKTKFARYQLEPLKLAA